MQPQARGIRGGRGLALLLLASAISSARGLVKLGRRVGFLGRSQEDGKPLSTLSTEADAVVASILGGASLSRMNLTAHIEGMALEDAVDGLLKTHKALPDVLARILQQIKHDKGAGRMDPPSEEMLHRAREILNGLIEQAQVELDTETVKCKEFHDSNREMHGQAMADLNRISGQIGNLARMMGQAEASIQDSIDSTQLVEEEIVKVQKAYDQDRLVDETMMASRMADLNAATFIMRLTACPKSAASLIEVAEAGVELCSNGTHGGGANSSTAVVASFRSPMLAAYAKNLSAEGFAILQEKLQNAGFASLPAGSTEAPAGNASAASDGELTDGIEFVTSMRQALIGDAAQADDASVSGKPKGKKGGKKAAPVTTTTMPPTSQPPVPVSSKPDNPAKQANKCTLGKPNCGLLNDGMSLMWGEMKDAVDALTAEMTRKEHAHKDMLNTMNQEKKGLADAIATAQEELQEATASKGVEVASQQEKSAEAGELQKEFDRVWGECKFTMNEILFTKICGTKKVRGTVLKHSKVVTPDKVVDCEVGDWIPGQCSMPCDDKLVGGMENLTREVVQNRNEYGIQCPILTLPKRCGMFPCPVHCKLSRFSGWSKCTKECEGGVQSRSRTMVVKPKNGGEPCESNSESQPCNTGSCDRDCSLKKWSKSTPCSQACGGGFSERFKRVKVPTRANGQCPAKMSKWRYKKSQCNTHPCVGDEVCVAKYDMVLAVDGSGSLRKKGFEVLRDFVALLTKKFQATHKEMRLNDKNKMAMKTYKAVKLGVVQFGNGRILPDGSIQGANIVAPLSSNLDKVEAAVKGMKWLKGFTNMAQAFTKSKDVLMNGGRKNAQSVVMVITDGKPSFNFQTEQELNKLRDNNVRVVMVPIKAYPGKMLAKMKRWASVPWKTNLVYIRGLKKLKREMDRLAAKVLVHSCSKAISPSAVAAQEAQKAEMKKIEKAIAK